MLLTVTVTGQLLVGIFVDYLSYCQLSRFYSIFVSFSIFSLTPAFITDFIIVYSKRILTSLWWYLIKV